MMMKKQKEETLEYDAGVIMCEGIKNNRRQQQQQKTTTTTKHN